VRHHRHAKHASMKMQRPGATLRATEGPYGGAPWGRSASGHGAQVAPFVRLRTLAHTARWRTSAGEQNHVSTDFFASSCPKFKWGQCNNQARRCEREEDPAVEYHGAGAPVAVEHSQLPSSDCDYLHSQVQRCVITGTQNTTRLRSNDRSRRCEPREGHTVGRHGAGAPVAVEHRRLPLSDCVHWHTRPNGAPARASKPMFQPIHPDTRTTHVSSIQDYICDSWFLSVH